MFYQNMLKTASSADQRNTMFTRQTNRRVCRVWIPIRAARADDDRGAVCNFLEPIQGVGGQHAWLDVGAERGRGVLQRGHRGGVVALLGRQVQQHGDVGSFWHPSSLAAALRPVGGVPQGRVPGIGLDALQRFALAVGWLRARHQRNHHHVLDQDVVHLDRQLCTLGRV